MMMKPTSYGATSDDERDQESRVVAPPPPSRSASPWTKRNAAVGDTLALLGAATTCAYVATSGQDVKDTAPAPHMSMQATAMAESLAASLRLGDSATFESLDVNRDGFVAEGEYVGQLEERKHAVLTKLRESNLPDEFKAPVTEILLDRFTSAAACVRGLFEQSGGDRLDQSSFAFVQPLIRSICSGTNTNAVRKQSESMVDTSAVTTPSMVLAAPVEVSEASSGSGSSDEPLQVSTNLPPIDNALPGENYDLGVQQNTQEDQPGESTGSASDQDTPSATASSSSSSGPASSSTETPDDSSSFVESALPPPEASTEGTRTEASFDATSAPSSDESGSAMDTTTTPPSQNPLASADGSDQNDDTTTTAPTDETTAPATATASEDTSGSEESSTSPAAAEGSTAVEETTAPVSANAASEEEEEAASASADGTTPVVFPGAFMDPSSSSAATGRFATSSHSNAGSLRGTSGSSSSAARPGSNSGDLIPQPSAPSTSGESDDIDATPAAASNSPVVTPEPSLVAEVNEALKDLNLPGESSSSGMAANPAAVKKFLEELNPANATGPHKEKSLERQAFESELTRQFEKLIIERTQKLAYARLQLKKTGFMVELMQECINHAGRRFELDHAFTNDEAVAWITDKCLVFSSMLTHGQH